MKPWVKVAAPDIPIPTRDRPTDHPLFARHFLSLFPFPVVAKKVWGNRGLLGCSILVIARAFVSGRNGARPSKEEAISFFFLLLVLLLSIVSSPRATGGHAESLAKKLLQLRSLKLCFRWQKFLG